MVDRGAAQAYDQVAGAYERGRAAYSEAAISYVIRELALEPGSVALDLGAGTGKLTQMLARAKLETVAVDPSRAMLDALRAVTPRAATIVGVAEAIPLPDRTIDVVTAGQAFHWFNARSALAEIRRVLEPHGGLALIWNRPAAGDPVQAILKKLTNPPERATRRGWEMDIPSLVSTSGTFELLSTQDFDHRQTTDEAALVDRVRSSSYVARLPERRRHAIEMRLKREITPFGPLITLTHNTIVYLLRPRNAPGAG